MSGFSNPIIGGGGALVYPSIHSPNFVGSGIAMPVGINNAQWPTISATVPGLQTALAYNGKAIGTNGIPASWPGPGIVFEPSVPIQVVDFTPNPVTDVISGALDGLLTTFFEGAPDGSYLLPLHEVQSGQNLNQFGYTGAQIQAMDSHMMALKNSINPTLLYGRGFSTYEVYSQGQNPTQYISEGVDFYSMDGYQTVATNTPDDIFGAMWDYIQAAIGSGADIKIVETNSSINPVTWIPAVYQWAIEHNITLLETYWTNPYFWIAASYSAMLNDVVAMGQAAPPGWSINKDGTAYFTGLTINDGIVTLSNSGGVFLYAGVPGDGNLVASVAPANGTDKFGNAYLAGLCSYQTGVGVVQVWDSTVVFYDAAGNGIGLLEAADGLLSLEQLGTGAASLHLWTTTEGGVAVPALTSSPLYGTDPSSGLPDGWNPLTIIGTGWGQQGSPYPTARYRAVSSPPNSVQIEGYLTPGGTLNEKIATVPAGYYPATGSRQVEAWCPATSGGTASQETPSVTIGDVGGLTTGGVPSGATALNFNGIYSLD